MKKKTDYFQFSLVFIKKMKWNNVWVGISLSCNTVYMADNFEGWYFYSLDTCNTRIKDMRKILHDITLTISIYKESLTWYKQNIEGNRCAQMLLSKNNWAQTLPLTRLRFYYILVSAAAMFENNNNNNNFLFLPLLTLCNVSVVL